MTTDVANWVLASEAGRMTRFLTAQRISLPRWLQRVTRTAAAGAVEPAPGRVATQPLVDVMAGAMRALLRPSMPVDFGASLQPRDMGIYGLVILTAPTVGEALERSVRFQRLMTTAGRMRLERLRTGLRWVWDCTQRRTLGVRARNEIVLTEHVAVMRALLSGAIPRRVSFMHSAPVDCAAHERFFACPIQWDAQTDSVEWCTSQLPLPLRLGVDATLSAFIEQEAQRQLGALPAAGLLEEVKDAVWRRLPHGDANLTTIAALLGRVPRSLRRDLSQQGCVFRALVDEVRRERAVELAEGGQHTMTQAALALGFSEVSAFSRAWRRWFSRTFQAASATPPTSPTDA